MLHHIPGGSSRHENVFLQPTIFKCPPRSAVQPRIPASAMQDQLVSRRCSRTLASSGGGSQKYSGRLRGNSSVLLQYLASGEKQGECETTSLCFQYRVDTPGGRTLVPPREESRSLRSRLLHPPRFRRTWPLRSRYQRMSLMVSPSNQ